MSGNSTALLAVDAVLVVDPAALSTFNVIRVLDPSELDNDLSRASGPRSTIAGCGDTVCKTAA
jgi:hypothetical protein